ncbi:MAG: DNA repair protein RadA [Candidatus Marinimicrobia bacterium]|nr:DNA repair protein RadA [Candidatus Neomarinimicrobiota bacterium]
MVKHKDQFKCTACDGLSPKWQGQCPHCGEWNTLEAFEEVVTSSKRVKAAGTPPSFYSLSNPNEPSRYASGIEEFDRVVGGGLMEGSIVLLGGDPGIGKSTLALQLCKEYVEKNIKVCYFSGEESVGQLALRAKRLGFDNDALKISNEIELSKMLAGLESEKPQVAVIDSIQTAYSPNSDSLPGSPNQVRECASELMTLGKTKNITIILIGHITKSGVIAGPKLLEHIVDTVLYLEGDKQHYFRILRSVKNRFGATHEIGIFEMKQEGLTGIANPGDMFLNERKKGATGSVVTCGMEGSRPLLVEIQALAARAAYGTPQRHASGIDQKRLQLLLAVIERQLDIPISQYDIFVNVVGGMTLKEPAMDLPVIAAIYSSVKNIPVKENTVIIGEVGLTGETRSVMRLEQRVKEAQRMGFDRLILPLSAKKKVDDKENTFKYIKDITELTET